MKRTYEELEAELAKTQELLKQALDEIARLKEQINRNSKNSSKSPSTDQKGNTPDKKKKERPTRAGKARSLFPPERIDRHIKCTQDNCPHCGSELLQLSNHSAEVLQQAELPEAKAIVTEYQLLRYQCNACGKNSIASLPQGVPDSAFGPKLMGLVATLTGVFHLAKREAIQLIKELYGVDMSTGSITNIEERTSIALDPIYQRIYHFVIESSFCKHFDETGWRDSGKRHFAWIASCGHAAFYRIDRERSSAAFHRLIKKCPKNFSAVTDRYAVYNSIGTHQYCLAHLIREFKKYAERDGLDKEIGEALVRELKSVCHKHGEYREGKIMLQQRNQQLGRHKRKVQTCLEDGMANGSDQLYRLSENLLDDFDKLWAFTKSAEMEPTNNMAERDLRKLVIWRKKSYGTRSPRGQRFVERITTVAQTARKRGRDVLGLIQEALMKFYANIDPYDIFEALKA
jgi:transposase